jgi:hypothetical protein
MADEDREQRTSDLPADLTREREAFVRQFLRKGVEVTEALLKENREMREQLQCLRDENARLRAQIASDDAIRDLLRKIEQLESERRALRLRSDELEQWTRQSEIRAGEIEQELHDLANLYIASSHLHGTLSVRGVVKRLSELLHQFMGAERWVLYLLDVPGEWAQPLVSMGLPDPAPLPAGEGPIGLAMSTGLARIKNTAPLPAGTLEDPLAVVPLMVRDVCVGAIAVVALLPQKEKWAAVDHALFEFLGPHTVAALMAANQCANANHPRAALQGIAAHLSAGLRAQPAGLAGALE